MGKASRKKKQNPMDAGAGLQEQARAFPLWILAALCLVAFLAYARTLSFDFVYDDDAQVLRNPWIRDWSQVGNFFFSDVWSFSSTSPGSTNYYRPLHMVAHAVGYTISGLQPYGFHLINILLHSLSTLLVALFAYRLTRDRLVGAASGFLFALHPVHAESVSWVAGITDPLCAVFYFGALTICLNEDQSKGKKIGFLSALMFLGALLSKEMAFTLPLMVVWLDGCLKRKLYWGRYATMMASFGIYAVFRVHALGGFSVNQLQMNLSFHDRLLSSAVLLGEYLAKAFVPFNINAFHVFHPTVSVSDYRFLLSVLVILGLAWAAWIFRNDRRMLFLIGFMPISLLPVLNLNGIGESIFADRYLYIPSLASCLLISLLIQKTAKVAIPKFDISERKIIFGMAGGICLVYAYLLYGTSLRRRDNITLYTETLKRSPDSANFAAALGWHYFEAGQIKDAEYWIRRSEENWKRSYIKRASQLRGLYVGLSSVYLREGKPQEAMECLDKAHAIDPGDPGVLQNMAAALILTKNFGEARKACEAAISANPRNENSYNNLAYVFLQQNEPDRAIENAQKAIKIFPKFADAYLNLARGYAAKGLMQQAREAYLYARQLKPELQPAADQELSLIK
jgi:protein O-mannosyl-transferase